VVCLCGRPSDRFFGVNPPENELSRPLSGVYRTPKTWILPIFCTIANNLYCTSTLCVVRWVNLFICLCIQMFANTGSTIASHWVYIAYPLRCTSSPLSHQSEWLADPLSVRRESKLKRQAYSNIATLIAKRRFLNNLLNVYSSVPRRIWSCREMGNMIHCFLLHGWYFAIGYSCE